MFNGAAGNRESNTAKNTGTKYVFIPEGPISEKLPMPFLFQIYRYKKITAH